MFLEFSFSFMADRSIEQNRQISQISQISQMIVRLRNLKNSPNSPNSPFDRSYGVEQIRQNRYIGHLIVRLSLSKIPQFPQIPHLIVHMGNRKNPPNPPNPPFDRYYGEISAKQKTAKPRATLGLQRFLVRQISQIRQMIVPYGEIILALLPSKTNVFVFIYGC